MRCTASQPPIKFIYLRFAVGFVCCVHVYTSVDFLCPYRRFKRIILHGIFKYIYVYPWIFIYVYVYSPPIFIYVYIHIYLTHFLHMCIHIFYYTYVCFFKALHIDHLLVRNRQQDRLQPSNSRSV